MNDGLTSVGATHNLLSPKSELIEMGFQDVNDFPSISFIM